MDGIIFIDKAPNITSNQTLKQIRRELNLKSKSGIVGILDPLATGMLPIVIGKATKLSKHIESFKKTYHVKCELGKKSTTGDYEGIITQSHLDSGKKIHANDIINIFKKFLGEQNQIPPMYSGLKINGKKLYKLARQGIVIPRKPREIFIYDLKYIQLENLSLEFVVTCSKGTYIRTLVEDICSSLGTSGYVTFLRRIKVGSFSEKNMITINNLPKVINIQSNYFFCPEDILILIPNNGCNISNS